MHQRRGLNLYIYVCIIRCVVCGGAVSSTSAGPSTPVNLTDEGATPSLPLQLQNELFEATTEKPKRTCDQGQGVENLKMAEANYSMKDNFSKILPVQNLTSMIINVTDIDIATMNFLIVQAHSQNKYIILSHNRSLEPDWYINSTDPGLVVDVDELAKHHSSHGHTFTLVHLVNCHKSTITVLLMVRNYTHNDPVPGRYKKENKMPEPYLRLYPNLLTTKITFRAATKPMEDKIGIENEIEEETEYFEKRHLRYDTYLTYMYERDLSEIKYWDTLINTSTIEGLRRNAQRVLRRDNNDTDELFNELFVSYSGVGAVITIMVSYNGSSGSLYSSAVSYGCDFIDAEEYRCTKLVHPLAKLFCASLVFIGPLMLFLGHRWLNFTMFNAGFLFTWCVLFILFAQISTANISALGWGTMLGAVLGGVGWLLFWHKIHRPFHSALIIILLCIVFVGMTITFFIRYAVLTKTNYLTACVIFTTIFAVLIIAYAIIDIKKVHILSCTVLGSYGFIVPLAFYLGSSLTYIIINIVALFTVPYYSDTLGHPPFQVCDIILLCLWLVLLCSGLTYQLYREKSGPPFHPPNLSWWYNTKKAVNFVLDKTLVCLPLDPDPGGAGIEDRPIWLLRLTYSFKLLRHRLPCASPDLAESGYQSFQRVRHISRSSESLPGSSHSSFASLDSTQPSRLTNLKARAREWVEKMQTRFKRDMEKVPEDEETVAPELHEDDDEARLLDDQD